MQKYPMKIIKKEVLTKISTPRLVRMEVAAPLIARKIRPGQFIVVMGSPEAERVPLTVVEATDETITIIFQEAGLSTKLLGQLNAGDELFAVLGPLGHATPLEKFGTVAVIGGGVGIAEIYPVVKGLKASDNTVLTIIGARTKELLILKDELLAVSDELFITTDDGSYGEKAFTTDILSKLLAEGTIDRVYAVGPIPMMQKVAEVTRPKAVPTVVSLNVLMLDATGMCGVCRVTVGGEVKFACVDGPEFDAHAIDWDEVIKRNRVYVDKEKHVCNLYKI